MMNNDPTGRKRSSSYKLPAAGSPSRLAVALIAAALLVLLGVILFFTLSSSGGSDPDHLFSGTYRYRVPLPDGGTAVSAEYVFNGRGKGKMVLPQDGEEYAYCYFVEGDRLLLDFEDDRARDCVYTFVLSGSRLTLTGGAGTTGGTWELSRE